jgi:hypothetical protein
MLEARVSTVDAIEWRVCVEARADRADAKSFSAVSVCGRSCSHDSASSLDRRVLIQNLQTKYVMAAIQATPPTTPPAMAPALMVPPAEVEAVADAEGLRVHTARAHSEQLVG